MCGARLPTAALYCEACGTDLSRAGAVFATEIHPVTRRPLSRRRVMRLAALGVGATAALLILLVGVGSIPTVSARVPAILIIVAPIRGAINQAMEWGSDRFWVPRSKPTVPPDQLTQLPTGGPLTSSPSLTPMTPYFVVKSTPEGAYVYVDMQIIGKTPLILYNLEPGVYSLRVEYEGYTATRQVTLRPNVGTTVSVKLETSEWSTGTQGTGTQGTAPKPKAQQASPPKVQPARKTPALQIGASAPTFSLKDRFGVIYRLSDYKGRRVAVLFIWDLNDAARHAVRNLSAGVGPRGAVVVMVRPDRAAIRQFVEGERITVPILLGHETLASQYGVPEDVAVLIVISEQGHVQSRQIARNQ
jgi:peroxiredoxin